MGNHGIAQDLCFDEPWADAVNHLIPKCFRNLHLPRANIGYSNVVLEFRHPEGLHHPTQTILCRRILNRSWQVEISCQTALQDKNLIQRRTFVSCILSTEVMQCELDGVQDANKVDIENVQLRLLRLFGFD